MIARGLRGISTNGRIFLIAGLIAGIALPPLAEIIRQQLPFWVSLLLFLNAFRIGHKAMLRSRNDISVSLAIVVILQLVLPCCLILLFGMIGFFNPIITGIILLTTASAISGSPNLTSLLGHEPASALRLLVIGTAILPITVIPVFLLSPEFGSLGTVILTASKLFLVIAAATCLAFFLRHRILPIPRDDHIEAIDGLSVLAMAIVVIGLMSALGPALFENPNDVLLTLIAAFGINYLLQICGFYAFYMVEPTDRVGMSVVAGNRNMALFLAALPTALTDQLLLFIACYQLPMYLTPMLMQRFYMNRS